MRHDTDLIYGASLLHAASGDLNTIYHALHTWTLMNLTIRHLTMIAVEPGVNASVVEKP